ncbi:MAG: MotA/TolQ/ExbB proton channel family protein [Rhodospirillales bacterium]
MAEELRLPIAPPRTGPDAATIFGLLGGFGLMAAAIVLGGSPESFLNLPAVLIVVGGTLAITVACYSFPEVWRTLGVAARTVLQTRREPYEAAIQVLRLSEVARRSGVLHLQGAVEQLKPDPLLHQGIIMVIDGTPGEEIEAILRREVQSTLQRHQRSANVLRRMAEFSPAMGLIGTLIGLVQMLGNLEDPSSIGPSMAVALLTTFYGAVLANMVFLPVAAKLERNSASEALISNIHLMGAASIGRQENPRRLEMYINSILPPADRVTYFD